MAMTDSPSHSTRLLRWLHPSKPVQIALAILLIVCLASFIRFEIFASAKAPPSSEWNDLFSTPGSSLENVPVIISTRRVGNEMTVTVANQGGTPLCYRAVDRTGIQVFWELEDWGHWKQAGWDWCGMGKEDFELTPGEEVALNFYFEDPRRERMLGNFGEKGTKRRGLVVLACENRRLTLDPQNSAIPVGASLAAFGIWMTVRIINRRGSEDHGPESFPSLRSSAP